MCLFFSLIWRKFKIDERSLLKFLLELIHLDLNNCSLFRVLSQKKYFLYFIFALAECGRLRRDCLLLLCFTFWCWLCFILILTQSSFSYLLDFALKTWNFFGKSFFTFFIAIMSHYVMSWFRKYMVFGMYLFSFRRRRVTNIQTRTQNLYFIIIDLCFWIIKDIIAFQKRILHWLIVLICTAKTLLPRINIWLMYPDH